MRSRRSQWGGLTELQLLWLQELESAGRDKSNREAQMAGWLKISQKKFGSCSQNGDTVKQDERSLRVL